ncbi:hypothetical protein C809_00171 [Lachnospiraceae bacterium MD335]|nr:hypothetical protein C809_00171 [Lachnospiraceae bacterium MD335]
MKIFLILFVIIECLILILLTVLKKWTKKVFIIVSAFTVLSCLGLGIASYQSQTTSESVDQRGQLYIATRLIEEDYLGESLEALSGVTDDVCLDLNSRIIRALSYNLNEAYQTAETYLNSGNNNVLGEQEQLILDASIENREVGSDERDNIIVSTLSLINATESEMQQWEAEMKVRFMGFHLSDEEKEDLSGDIALLRLAVSEKRFEDAYNTLANDTEIGVRDAVILSNMYVRNYNHRVMSDTDDEYAQLWNNAAKLQSELNVASLSLLKEENNDDSEGDDTDNEIKDEYQLLEAKYSLALTELNQESIKRAINYLNSVDAENSEYQLGYELQLARLYFMSNQYDKSKEYIYQIFTSDSLSDSMWLGKEIETFKDAYINYISNSTSNEYSILFDKLMMSVYQSVFDDENFSSFKEFVMAYLREIFGGIVIRRVNISNHPQITAEISVSRSDINVDSNSILITDTLETIQNFSVETIEVNDLSLSIVLDISGSMQGNNITDSKNAIRDCISQLGDDVSASFVTFSNSANLECALTDSKYLIMNLVEATDSDGGGTYISSGLSTAIDALSGSSGSRVIILLSDGADFDESKALMDGVLTEAIANNISIYTIGLQGCEEEYLQMIATRTGGQFIMVTNVAELDRTYQEIQNAMMNNYLITYSVSDEQDSRSIKIKDTGSYAEARKEYLLSGGADDSYIYENGLQEAGYYKQIGGTDLGR